MRLNKAPIAKAIFLAAFASFALLFLCSFYESYEHACNNSGYPDDAYCTGYRFIPYALWQAVELFKELGEVIVALATVALCFFTWSLADSTEKLWDETRDAGRTARRSASSGMRNARAAMLSARVAKDTLDANNRPWIKLEISAADSLVIQDGKLSTRLNIETTNLGNSPAIAVKSGVFIPSKEEAGCDFAELLMARSAERKFKTLPGETYFPHEQKSGTVKVDLETANGSPCLIVWAGYVFTFGDKEPRFSAIAIIPYERRVVSQDGSIGKLKRVPLTEFSDGTDIALHLLSYGVNRTFIN